MNKEEIIKRLHEEIESEICYCPILDDFEYTEEEYQ